MRIMEDLVEYTSPFHNWKHLRDDMKSIADEWGGSGGGGGGKAAGASTGASTPSTPLKGPPSSGGTTHSFFGKKPSKSGPSSRAAKDTSHVAIMDADEPKKGSFQHRGGTSSGVASRVSSIAQAKEKEVQKEKLIQQDKEAAKIDKPKGCIPFLGKNAFFFSLYLLGIYLTVDMFSCLFFHSNLVIFFGRRYRSLPVRSCIQCRATFLH